MHLVQMCRGLSSDSNVVVELVKLVVIGVKYS